jgi:MatE
MQASCVLSPQARKLAQPEACSKPRARPVETDLRTHMLLAKPIAPTILRLAVPNSTVMIVQILIGLLEVYFVSGTGVDALAGVSPVFPLVSLVVALAQGALGGGIVTTVARVLGAGRDRRSQRIRVVRRPAGCSARPFDDRGHGCIGSNPLRTHGCLRKCSGDRRLLFIRHFCRRHGDLVVQPTDGGGPRHRQPASSGDCGLWRRIVACPAFVGPDLRRF